MSDYLENKAIGSYFRSETDGFIGVIRLFGTYTEYRVVEGIPAIGCMLEIIDVENGILLTRVNNSLFENGRGYLWV